MVKAIELHKQVKLNVTFDVTLIACLVGLLLNNDVGTV